MLTKIVVAALAAALALPVSPSRADPPAYDCGFRTVQVRGSGLTDQGVMWGYAVHADGGPVTIKCTIRVNGINTDNVAIGRGVAAVAVAVDTVFLIVDPGDHVEICAELVTSHGATGPFCDDASRSEIPPPAVVDLLCSVTTEIGRRGFNVLGLVEVRDDGHVYVASALIWYCRESATSYGA